MEVEALRVPVIAVLPVMPTEVPDKFKAPALVIARVPLVVVLKVNGPAASVTVKPPAPGPVMDLAATPEKVTLLPRERAGVMTTEVALAAPIARGTPVIVSILLV
jgi:hypothetical protein